MSTDNGHVKTKEWNLHYTTFIPQEEKLRETLSTIGNGYFGTRGAFEGQSASDTHYPATYIAGLYNKVPSTVHGKEIFNADFVNCPNWLPVELSIDGEPVNPLQCKIENYIHDIDLHYAVMSRTIRFKDSKDRVTEITSHRFASMDNPHYAVMKYSVTPVNHDSKISLKSSLDGTVVNAGVERYKALTSKHLVPVDQGHIDEGIYLQVETTQSHVQIAMCARHRLFIDDKAIERPVIEQESSEAFASETFSFDAAKNKTYTLEKLVTISTSRDEHTASPFDKARALLSREISYDTLFYRHKLQWRLAWRMSDIRIEGDAFAQMVTRLYAYHLMATSSVHTVGMDAGMPARGLHGEAYRGHIFWDSLYVLPFFYRRFPDVAKGALMYRYRRLDPARTYAFEHGYEGAMFPWQSADDGREETQVIHFNPVSGLWDPDLSSRQRHVSIAIFYNVWEYYNYTQDEEFLYDYGLEMMLEISRFWVSIAKKDPSDNKYHIRGVMGPDEFHEKYPDRDEGGLDDNAYTNVMTAWLLEKMLEIADHIPEMTLKRMCGNIGMNKDELEIWREMTTSMYVPFIDKDIISQFEGYEKLKEIDWEAYKKKYGNISRMDRILKSENDSPDDYQVAKQADTLMLFYVLTPGEVVRVLGKLGYDISDPKVFLKKNYDYYIKRTTHGSTLSKIVHASIAHQIGAHKEAWNWYVEALKSDIFDTQGGTTTEGIHCGVMAGAIKLVTFVFAGLTFEEGRIELSPALPDHWKRLGFRLQLRGRFYSIEVTQNEVTVRADERGERPLMIRVDK